MDRRHRLVSSSDFVRVRRSGRSYAHPLVVLVASPSELPGVRVGVSAGKALGGAVARNRAKRRLREALRPQLPTLRPGWDLVLIARPALLGADWESVLEAISGLLQRAGIAEPNG
jgi:ribonuclease P protein component